MHLMSKRAAVSLFLGAAMIVTLLSAPAAKAAPTLAEVQAKVRILEEDATAAAEGAQEAKVKLESLTKTLTGIKQKAAVQGQNVSELSKSLGTIAIDQYKNGGLSQSLELLFSSDPTLYLSAAGSLDALTRRKSIQLNKFEAAEQRLNATTLTVADKVALIAAAQKKYQAQARLAQSKLAEAEKLLAQLKKEDRERLARLAEEQENADQASSIEAAKKAQGVSGRAGTALKYALKQIGDRYVFGADGLTTWDCSGLTMRAFQSAGVSLPHSSAAQFRYGKLISRSNLKAGDLVFFGSPISHVGIYLGGDKMVHAPRSGSRVKVATMDMGRKKFRGGKRL
jgi:cell wall-associated NlpC family hydrolase